MASQRPHESEAFIYTSSGVEAPRNIDHVIVDSSVTHIDEFAFSGLRSLVSIHLPNSITSVSRKAFSDCTGLTSIRLPDYIRVIESYTFNCCQSLRSINIPNSVTNIGYATFIDCSALISVKLSASIIEIDNYAFACCRKLTSIHLPDSLFEIKEYVFCDCWSLSSVHLPSSVTSIGYSAFKGCRSLASISLPVTLTSIGCDTFHGCTSLTSIKLPPSISCIGINAFSSCSNLLSIELHLSSISTIYTNPRDFGIALEKASFFPIKLRHVLDNDTNGELGTMYFDWKVRAKIKDQHNRLPLHTAAARGFKWSQWVKKILHSNLAAIEEIDQLTGLEPFMLAAAGPNSCYDTAYNLLRENPAAVYFKNTSQPSSTRKGQHTRKRGRATDCSGHE